MSTHIICFRAEIRKIFTGYPPLSRPMEDPANAVFGGSTGMRDDTTIISREVWGKMKM